MVLALDAMRDQIEYYLLRCTTILLLIVVCFLISYSKKVDKDLSAYGVVLSIWLIIYLISSVFPFAKDAIQKNIVVETGIYSNHTPQGRQGRAMGICYPDLDTGDEVLPLITPPGRESIFVKGTHEVLAYYLPNAKVLLHIEILD